MPQNFPIVLYQVGLCLDPAQNHSSSFISSLFTPCNSQSKLIYMQNYVKSGSVAVSSNIAYITFLASSSPKVKLGQVGEYYSKSLALAPESHICQLYVQFTRNINQECNR